MKLRDRMVLGFCLSLVLITALFVVDLQTENARRLAAVESIVVAGGGGGGEGGSDGVGAGDGGGVGDGVVVGGGLHGRSGHRSRIAWDRISPSPPPVSVGGRPRPRPPAPRAPQPYPSTTGKYPPPPVRDPYAHDRFEDIGFHLARMEVLPHRGKVSDWADVRDVIVDDTYDDGVISNEYIVEYFENGVQ